MSLEAGIYDRLAARPGFVAIAGNRVYPGRFPDNLTLPALTYVRVAPRPRPQRLGGGGPVGLAEAVYQLDAWARDYDTAAALADQVRIAFDGFAGSIGGVTVSGASLLADRDSPEPETGLFRRILEIRIPYTESIA